MKLFVKKGIIIHFVYLLALFCILWFVISCGTEINPIQMISINNSVPDLPQAPIFEVPVKSNPYPNQVQMIFYPGDRLYLELAINDRVKGDIKFSKYTFFNRKTHEETQIESVEFGPFSRGSIVNIGRDKPWLVPEKPAVYELRVYLDKEKVSSGVFEVK